MITDKNKNFLARYGSKETLKKLVDRDHYGDISYRLSRNPNADDELVNHIEKSKNPNLNPKKFYHLIKNQDRLSKIIKSGDEDSIKPIINSSHLNIEHRNQIMKNDKLTIEWHRDNLKKMMPISKEKSDHDAFDKHVIEKGSKTAISALIDMKRFHVKDNPEHGFFPISDDNLEIAEKKNQDLKPMVAKVIRSHKKHLEYANDPNQAVRLSLIASNPHIKDAIVDGMESDSDSFVSHLAFRRKMSGKVIF